MKYVLVCGGVISGVGKGVAASSIGRILKDAGVSLTIIKIDPYLNFDAGTLGPRDHGEVFVLNDGTETDLDLGNYERFLGVNLTRKNSITTGRMYQEVITKERQGEFLGRTVQVVPHLTDHIKQSILDAAVLPIDGSDKQPDVCIIELGGVIGDIESITFLEALRQLSVEQGPGKFVVVGVDHLLELNGEHKTKPIQASAKRARELGIPYDLLLCRSLRPADKEAQRKMLLFTAVDRVIGLPDENVLGVPDTLISAGILEYLDKRLQLSLSEHRKNLETGTKYFGRVISPKQKTCSVAIIGKYNNREDAYLSIKESLRFAGSNTELDTGVEIAYFDISSFNSPSSFSQILEFDGVIIPGGFGRRGVEEMVLVAEYIRTNQIPSLGICLGMQVMVIEYARNMLGIPRATSEELVHEEDIHTIIDDKIHKESPLTPCSNGHVCVIEKHSDEIRVGVQETFTVPGTRLAKVYGNPSGAPIRERFRHRYSVLDLVGSKLEEKGMSVGIRNGTLIDGVECKDHPFYIGVQFHPEFLSKPNDPRCLFVSFLSACLLRRKQKGALLAAP